MNASVRHNGQRHKRTNGRTEEETRLFVRPSVRLLDGVWHYTMFDSHSFAYWRRYEHWCCERHYFVACIILSTVSVIALQRSRPKVGRRSERQAWLWIHTSRSKM